jgi:TonB family protein
MPAVKGTAELTLASLVDDTLARRIAVQVAFAAGELRRDPVGFFRTLWSADALDRRSRRRVWLVRLAVPTVSGVGFALGVALFAMLIGVAPASTQASESEPPGVVRLLPLPSTGGGGGGNEEQRPVSRGVPPPSSKTTPVATATTHDVPRPPDALPLPPPIKAPPVTIPDADRYGDPNSLSSDASDGPGRNGGAGTGDGGGWGPGTGPGEGPGEDGGRGGPDGPGRDEPTRQLATKAVILNAPRPSYTDEARLHKTEGRITVRALLGADGRVKRATVTRGLPHGLDERALEAVSRLAFRPARDGSGRPVDTWVSITVVFTIR